jgi:hypothetical protein
MTQQAFILDRSIETQTVDSSDSNRAEHVEDHVEDTPITTARDATSGCDGVKIVDGINHVNHLALSVLRYLVASSSSIDIERLQAHVRRTTAAAAAVSTEASTKVISNIAQRLEVTLTKNKPFLNHDNCISVHYDEL